MLKEYARQYQIKLLFRLEAELERDNKRIVDLRENETFSEGVGNFITNNYVLLSYGLQGIDSGGVSFSDLHHL